ncbi:MAG: hypothetical protein LBR17_08080 [Bacteroidales bacterium]|jgi:hypothetical protein|nr:hypothetical protein [Bacteroidales bacterium]
MAKKLSATEKQKMLKKLNLLFRQYKEKTPLAKEVLLEECKKIVKTENWDLLALCINEFFKKENGKFVAMELIDKFISLQKDETLECLVLLRQNDVNISVFNHYFLSDAARLKTLVLSNNEGLINYLFNEEMYEYTNLLNEIEHTAKSDNIRTFQRYRERIPSSSTLQSQVLCALKENNPNSPLIATIQTKLNSIEKDLSAASHQLDAVIKQKEEEIEQKIEQEKERMQRELEEREEQRKRQEEEVKRTELRKKIFWFCFWTILTAIVITLVVVYWEYVLIGLKWLAIIGCVVLFVTIVNATNKKK